MPTSHFTSTVFSHPPSVVYVLQTSSVCNRTETHKHGSTLLQQRLMCINISASRESIQEESYTWVAILPYHHVVNSNHMKCLNTIECFKPYGSPHLTPKYESFHLSCIVGPLSIICRLGVFLVN